MCVCVYIYMSIYKPDNVIDFRIDEPFWQKQKKQKKMGVLSDFKQGKAGSFVTSSSDVNIYIHTYIY